MLPRHLGGRQVGAFGALRLSPPRATLVADVAPKSVVLRLGLPLAFRMRMRCCCRLALSSRRRAKPWRGGWLSDVADRRAYAHRSQQVGRRHHSFGARRWRSRARARAARPRAQLCHAWRPAVAVCAAAAQRMARAAGVLMSQVRAPWEHALSAARATPTRATLVLAIQHPETACSNVDRHCFRARRLRDAKIRFVCLWLQRTFSRRFLGTHGICSRVWAFAGLIFSPNSRLAT